VEVLLENLNDNVREDFLRAMLLKCAGSVRHLAIAYHPSSKKHLGIAHVEFESEMGSSACLRQMQGKSVMGNIISASKDPLGKLLLSQSFSGLHREQQDLLMCHL
jgi:RNA recognition motif-containing protein